MKLLLTSNGLMNDTIKNALDELVGKPRKETKIAFIPTAGLADNFDVGDSRDWLANDIYWAKEFGGFIDIISLADFTPEMLIPRLEIADVIFVGGGNAFYLSYHMQRLGLIEALPKLLETRVYAGISAGSMIATPSIRTASGGIENREALLEGKLENMGPKGRVADKTLNLVNFCVRPHINRPMFEAHPNFLQEILEDTKVPLYALDDQSALKVVDGEVEVITEGEWKLLKP